MKLSNIKIITFEIVLILLSIVILFTLSKNNQDLYKATKNKLLMIETADKLRQSSDDLTHFARTYTVTADTKFKQQYYDTLNIRNGEKERPTNYNSIYWDLNKKDRNKNHKDSQKISLDSIFKSLPYDNKEIEKLKLSKIKSDILVNLEIEAFNAMLGRFKDTQGNYTIQDKPNQILAIKLMHSKEYYNAKSKIMKPIDDFILMLNKRTSKNISDINSLNTPFFILLGLILIIFIIGNYFIYRFLNNEDMQKIKDKNNLLIKQEDLNLQLQKSKNELNVVNDNLEITIIKEIEKNNNIQEKLYKSEKMASMGEMIGNIAHQWRQPLSVISTGATGMKLQKEYGCLTDDQFLNTCDAINDNAQYLSRTIDDFKNFIQGDRTKKVFNLKKVINSFLHLVHGSVKSHNLNIILDLAAHIEIDGYENELTQCLINIFNNAKDALIEKNIKNKLLFITTKAINSKAVISIKDNAGGIPIDILPKIFEPYFTTKHQSQGTGLGLHMTYNLIVDGMSGTIEVTNVSYDYNGHNYVGAEFIISL